MCIRFIIFLFTNNTCSLFMIITLIIDRYYSGLQNIFYSRFDVGFILKENGLYLGIIYRIQSPLFSEL